MRYLSSLLSAFLAIAVAGCAKPAVEVSTKAQVPADPKLLEPLLLTVKPASFITVTDARDKAKDGEEVVVQGQIPPVAERSFLAGRAGFMMISAADLEKNKEELECTEVDCPSCARLMDDLALAVELVDKSGAIIKTPVNGFKNIGPMSTITVKGKIEKKGKKAVLHATAIYIDKS